MAGAIGEAPFQSWLDERCCFSGLSAGAQQDLESIVSLESHSKGSVLFCEQKPARGVFIVCNGMVKLSESSSGRRVILGLVTAGEVLGASACVSGRPHEATATVVSSSQIGFISRAEFLEFLQKHADACLRLVEALSRQLGSAQEKVRMFGVRPLASEKLAQVLLSWCAQCGEETDKGTRMVVPLTLKEIAEVIGASRETVTRSLERFRRRRIAYRRGPTMLIRNKQALEAMTQSK